MDRAMPVLQVADVTRSIDFYCQKPGFTLLNQWGDGPDFAIVQRGKVTIALDRSRDGGVPVNQYWAAYIYTGDADALYREFSAIKVDIPRGPEETFYRMREFDVRDPDGHLVAFAHDLDA